jgi:RNA polymerase sigma-70 factor, ECF subfamily
MRVDHAYERNGRVVAGGSGLTIVWHWNARERRLSWLALLAARAFALRTHQQDDDAQESDASASPGHAPAPSAQSAYLAGPSGGHDAAFDAFFAQYERPLYGYLRRMLPSHDAALDVAQEAFFRAWQRFDVIGGYDRPQAWLFRVATNLALDVLRRRQPIELSRIFGNHDDATGDGATNDDAIPALMDPHNMERSLAERDLVNRLLRRLPERQRAALLLWAAHGLTTTEIAAIFETTEVNMRQMLSRGRARFRELYEQAQRSS